MISTPTPRLARRRVSPLSRACMAMAFGLVGWAAQAHDFKAGNVVVDHPYVLPSSDGTTSAYAVALRNTGRTDDSLVGATSPMADSVAVECVPAGGTAPQAGPLALPAGATVSLKHDGACALHVQGLKQPLRAGDHLPLTLRFEKAGAIELHVDVQQPRARRAAP